MTAFEKTVALIKKPWFIVVYASLMILAYFWVDIPVALFFHGLDLRQNTPILKVITAFGAFKTYLIVFGIAGCFFHYVYKKPALEDAAWYLLGCIAVTTFVVFVLKTTLSRARPELFFEQHAYGFYWFQLKSIYWSFPSGHTATVIALASGLGVLFPKYFYAFLGLALLVVLSRVLLCWHFVSDVMAGTYLSMLVVGLYTEYVKKHRYFPASTQ